MATISKKEKANAVRVLSMDAIQKANSGHPGAPMGMADIAEVLWCDYMKYNPVDCNWVDRDRFVLSNGHGSMLIYSLLHLTGYKLSMDDIKSFRQLYSKTPGHPEYGYAPGIETTTGPLGQGVANAVGMAIAEKTLAAQYNLNGHKVVDHHTYVFLGDGCMMEGVSHEACSLAGTLKLGKLIMFYDDNGISIDGEVGGWFTDDTPMRFESYRWHVVRDVDGHNSEAVAKAIEEAQAVTDRPSLICCKTIIGFGSPNKAGTEACHGAALGEEEVALTRKALNWEYDPFVIPAEIYTAWDGKVVGKQHQDSWNKDFAAYTAEYPDLAAEFTRRMNNQLPENWEQEAQKIVVAINAKAEHIASRKASQNAIEAFAQILPEFLGGSADLAGSNLTIWSGSSGIHDDPAGNYIYYGVREFAMSAIMNGIVLHGGFKPYGATFLMFSEYARNALRMAALMKLPCIFVYTHDSIGLGEDGPTHQAVEQLATLRLIPRVSVWRPCDAVETAIAWKLACESTEIPYILAFSRQNLPHQPRTDEQIEAIEKGGYILRDCQLEPEAIIIATGSEVTLAMAAAEMLSEHRIRVVSMPSVDVFEAQSQAWQELVLPLHIHARVTVEAGVSGYWSKYAGPKGKTMGVDNFGESAPANEVYQLFNLTVQSIAETVRSVL